ncbi:hypothetical protein Glove_58g18 [Diversispora epigaea]|uniref:Uncharacterized protein n=1 Tax=Diversispora epigaea TaxID=1348612 RepID=A0A397JIX5_9GLOM|nr:hypothetical protein Glove_58g18 [Diversispora epigaea]
MEPRAKRNRNLFAYAIARSTSSGSTTSRRTRLGTNPSEPYLVEEERVTTTTRTETIFGIWDLGFGISAKNTNYNLGFGIWDFGIWDFDIWILNLGGRYTNSINRLIRKFELFEKKMDLLLNDNADIKKRLKNIKLLTEINNDPDFSKLLEKLREMRGGIASRVKSAIFEIFEESQLPRIDFQSFPAEINSWKSDQRVRHAYRKLFDVFSEDRTYVQPLKPEEGELNAEETSEEESEEEEEEGKSLKRRKTLRGHVPSPGRAPSTGRVSPPLTSPSRLLPEYFNTEGEGRQRAREVLQRLPEG